MKLLNHICVAAVALTLKLQLHFEMHDQSSSKLCVEEQHGYSRSNILITANDCYVVK
jgi:hypothetical protein